MVCHRCGSPYKSEDRFCGFCGYNLSVTNSSNFVTMHAIHAKDIQYDLGLLYFKEGKYQEALEIFEKIQKETPDNLQVINMYERTREALNGSDLNQ